MDYQLLKQRGALNDAHIDADEIVAEWGTEAPIASSTLLSGQVDLSRLHIPTAILQEVPPHICWQNSCIPFAKEADRLLVAVPDASKIALADQLTFLLNRNVRLVGARVDQIHEALRRHGVPDDPQQILYEYCDSVLNEFTETAINYTAASESEPPPQIRSRPASPPSRLVKACRDVSDDEEQQRRRLQYQLSKPRAGMFYYTIPDGTRVMQTRLDGTREVLIGPKRVWKGRSEFYEMTQYIAHPGDYLIVRFRDGHQEHIAGPAEIWHDPRVHDRIERAEGLQIASKEAIVVYSQAPAQPDNTARATTRRIVYGPHLFVPQPGEWLHTFSWHASKGGSAGVEKVPNGLVFQKLWLMPDQMYHDVHHVRTSDDAVLTIRLMLFFELTDIALMLESTHDPIGDFVNAATADIVEFTGRFDFEAFKHNTEKLNELATYKQLSSRAKQIGYHIHTVVYRGYGAADSLQQMHNQAIEARTKLQLDRATEQQSQELESFRLESQLARAAKRRSEQGAEVRHDLELNHVRSQSELEIKQAQHHFVRDQWLADAKVRDAADRIAATQRESHLAELHKLGVDLTAYLTQSRADQVFEFRGQSTPHVHVDSKQHEQKREIPEGEAR